MIEIKQDRLVVSVSGVDEKIIALVLSYQYKFMSREWVPDPKTGRTRMVEKQDFETRNLYTVLEDGLILFQHGLVDRLMYHLGQLKMEYTFEDMGEVDCTPDYDNLKRVMPEFEFRPNQDVAVSIVIALNCGQIVAPAAFGKTQILTVLCALYPSKSIVIVTPGAQLARDTHNRIQEVFVDENIGLLGAGGKTFERITVSTYHSLKKYPPNKAQVVFVDECHRAPGPQLAEALSSFTKVEKMFGFTASPEGRSDGAELVTESLLGPVRFKVDYTEAMAQGVVAPMRVMLVDIKSGPNEKNFKTYITRQRNLLWKNQLRNKVIANSVIEYTKSGNVLGLDDPQVLILVGTSCHLENLSKLLPDFELIYKSVGSTDLPKLNQKEIDDRFDRFQRRELKKVIATGCWGIGVDFPDLDLVVMASGKSGPIDVIQFTGRCTRRGTGDKEFGYVLDFKDQWSYWAKCKANKRIALYKEMGWEIYE